jgi:hypothetical protein
MPAIACIDMFCYTYYNGAETKIAGGILYYHLYPTWNYINLAFYNIMPLIFILIFNILIIRHLILIKRTLTL